MVLPGRGDEGRVHARSGCWPRAGSSTTRSSGGRTTRYQQVVDHFKGRIEFVQVGEAGHHHPSLRGVVDLRGMTGHRQLVRLVYHAQGVISAVSFLMHLAAAVEVKPGMPKNRPCVVVAGRARAPAVDGVSPSPVHPHRGGAALLRQRRVLEVAHASARRRRREGQPRPAVRGPGGRPAPLHGHDHGGGGLPPDRDVLRRGRDHRPDGRARISSRPPRPSRACESPAATSSQGLGALAAGACRRPPPARRIGGSIVGGAHARGHRLRDPASAGARRVGAGLGRDRGRGSRRALRGLGPGPRRRRRLRGPRARGRGRRHGARRSGRGHALSVGRPLRPRARSRATARWSRCSRKRAPSPAATPRGGPSTPKTSSAATRRSACSSAASGTRASTRAWPPPPRDLAELRRLRGRHAALGGLARRAGPPRLRPAPGPRLRRAASPRPRRAVDGRYLRDRGWSSARLRWFVEYGCRDDFGATLGPDVGLGGHPLLRGAARRRAASARRLPDLAGGQRPPGRAPGRAAPERACARRPPSRRRAPARRAAWTSSTTTSATAACAASAREHAVFALPRFLAALRRRRSATPPARRRASTARGWSRTSRCATARSRAAFPLAWDNVLYDSPSLGYVVATHQQGRDHGPTVFTYYLPLLDDDPRVARAAAAGHAVGGMGGGDPRRPRARPPRPRATSSRRSTSTSGATPWSARGPGSLWSEALAASAPPAGPAPLRAHRPVRHGAVRGGAVLGRARGGGDPRRPRRPLRVLARVSAAAVRAAPPRAAWLVVPRAGTSPSSAAPPSSPSPCSPGAR